MYLGKKLTIKVESHDPLLMLEAAHWTLTTNQKRKGARFLSVFRVPQTMP